MPKPVVTAILLAADNASVPYVGLRAFTEEEAPLFFGREREKIELTRLVESDTVSILYGVSGVGKSSLLNAGLFPRLRERNYLPVRLRLDHDEKAPPLARQLQNAVHAAAQKSGVSLPEPGENETLWEYFHHRERAEFWTDDHRLLTAALALDQFEEFFSLGHESEPRRARSEAFRAELLDLLENVAPPAVLSDPASFRLSAECTPRCLLILREDFIAQLLPIVDSLAERLPGVHRQKLRLLPLAEEDAREVIAGPTRALGLAPPDEETARAIVRLATPPGGNQDMTSPGGVEPARLALLLSALEGERRSRGLPRIDANLAALAGADLFARFVDGALADQPEAARLFVEDELVTPAGYRSDATADQAAARYGLEESTLQLLRERRLLTARPGWPVRYELSHDLLCPPLRKSSAQRQAREAEHRAHEAAAAAAARVRRALRVALIALAVAAVAVGGVIFALLARAEAEHQRLRAVQNELAAKTAEAETSRQKTRAVDARKAADGLINFMQYDLRDRLGPMVPLDMMESINARIRRYEEEHPPEAGNQAAQNDADRERGVALNQAGDLFLARGQIDDALKSYQDGYAIFAKLAARDPGNVGWQRDLSVSFENLGEVQHAQGDLPAALKSYQDSLVIARKLAARDPGNASWQRDLAVSVNKVGDVQQAQGDLTAALKSYEDGLAITLKLAAQDPGNADWQRDLSISSEKVGDVQQAQGNRPAALKSYQDSLAIRQKLAARDPGNAGWQRDLSVGLNKVGDVQHAQGGLPAALKSYEDGLAIARKLVIQDPGNADWQRDLSISFNKVGDVQKAQGDLPAVLKSYQDSLAITRKLAAQDPGNAEWQLDLAYGERNVGEVLIKQNKKDEARPRYEHYRQIVDRLASEHPGNYLVETDRAFARWLLVDCLDTRIRTGKEQARPLLNEAASILHALDKSPGLQPRHAGWLRGIENDLKALGK